MPYFRTESGGEEAPTLLWTNPSPTSNFAAQTLSLDLTEYAYLLFKVKNSLTTGYTDEAYCACQKDNSKRSAFSVVGAGAPKIIHSRYFDTTDNSITFSAGYHSSTSSGTTDNRYAIPLEIYGIKKSLI